MLNAAPAECAARPRELLAALRAAKPSRERARALRQRRLSLRGRSDCAVGRVDESALKENFTTVYQLLEEVLDNGYPLITEVNALKGTPAALTLTTS